MADEQVWPVVVERTQIFVIGVRAANEHAALMTPITKLWLDDPVVDEYETHSPDASEREAYAEQIAYELDDANF